MNKENDLIKVARRDPKTDMVDGRPHIELIDGVSVRQLTTLIDRRGSVFEMFDKRWNWSADSIDFVYSFSVRPGFVKGWGMHKEHMDRYCLISGEMDLVLFDAREDSPTYNKLCRIPMSEYNRCIVCIPKMVWHADHNIGSKDAVVINFPTKPYDHSNPDKYRLPIDTDLIPYDFGNAQGG